MLTLGDANVGVVVFVVIVVVLAIPLSTGAGHNPWHVAVVVEASQNAGMEDPMNHPTKKSRK
jgi:hypothetical protein